jgi:hypothetical protein
MFDIDGVLARSVRVDFVVRLIVNAPSGFQADWRYVHSSNGCTARDIHSIRMANFRRLFVYKYGGLHRPHDSILRHYQNKLCQGDAIAFSAFKLTGREQRDASSIRDIWNDLNDPNVRRLLHDLNFDRSQPYRILTAFSGSQTFDAPSSSLAFKRTIGDAQIWESGLCPVEDASMELIAEGLDNVLDYVIDFEIPASTNQKTVSTSFYEAWCEIIGADTLIPYDLTERKRKFAHVYEKYPRIVERYEKRRR